ncbi:MAG: NTP transferase domain-containing protein [Oligoflexia bacterium]|nr:NTP transferase domain-containing protein [Oligoflexia bacterium]
MKLKAFLQARMSSTRLPGKILTDLHGKPLYLHVYESISKILNVKDVVIVTSIDPTDDPFCIELEKRGLKYFRGDLDNVLKRFCNALNKHPTPWVMRINCDSPLIKPVVIQQAIDEFNESYDLITNVFPRSFPKGQSVEIIKSERLKELLNFNLNADQKEHVTKYFYDYPERFKIKNFYNKMGDQSQISEVVDTQEDLNRLKQAKLRL